VPQSFKMALPSTTQELSPNSVQGKQPELGIDEINEWPALPSSLLSSSKEESAAANKEILAKNSLEKGEFQISKAHGPSGLIHNQGP
jgi:hypothetical protein